MRICVVRVLLVSFIQCIGVAAAVYVSVLLHVMVELSTGKSISVVNLRLKAYNNSINFRQALLEKKYY